MMRARPTEVERLDWYAAHAPAVPEWFKPKAALPERPVSVTERFGKDRANEFFSLLHKGSGDPEIREYYQQVRTQVAERDMVVAEITYIEWCAHYAKMMVAALPLDEAAP